MKPSLKLLPPDPATERPKTQFATDGGHVPRKLCKPHFDTELVKFEPDGLLKKRTAELVKKRGKKVSKPLTFWGRVVGWLNTK